MCRFVHSTAPDYHAASGPQEARLLFLDKERCLFRLTVVSGDIALRTSQLAENALYAISGLFWHVPPGGNDATPFLAMNKATKFV